MEGMVATYISAKRQLRIDVTESDIKLNLRLVKDEE